MQLLPLIEMAGAFVSLVSKLIDSIQVDDETRAALRAKLRKLLAETRIDFVSEVNQAKARIEKSDDPPGNS